MVIAKKCHLTLKFDILLHKIYFFTCRFKMKAFRLSLVTILLVAVVLPSVMGTFGPFKGGRNPMHAMMKHIMRMPKMIANTFHKGMRGKYQ